MAELIKYTPRKKFTPKPYRGPSAELESAMTFRRASRTARRLDKFMAEVFDIKLNVIEHRKPVTKNS